MKKFIRCKKCARRLMDYGVGCTFGEPGDPEGYVRRPVETHLSGHETVYGGY